MEFSITLIIVILTCIVSIGGFNSQKTIDDLIFYPPLVQRGQVYRFISHGLILADPAHLIFNMLALYSFGESLEKIYAVPFIYGSNGKLIYLLLYFTALIIASVPDFFKHKDNSYYRSLGASGAVSAVVFSAILFSPNSGIGLIFLPGLNIPGYIFAIIYLVISSILAKRGNDNIGHTAHITGAIYGLVFTFIATKLFTQFDILDNFWRQVTGK